jgi:hypothetical protein
MKIKDLAITKYKFARTLNEKELRNLATIVKTIQDLESNIELTKGKIRMAKRQVDQYKQDKLKCEKELIKLGIEKVIKEEI